MTHAEVDGICDAEWGTGQLTSCTPASFVEFESCLAYRYSYDSNSGCHLALTSTYAYSRTTGFKGKLSDHCPRRTCPDRIMDLKL
jgi:hypothetical protein